MDQWEQLSSTETVSVVLRSILCKDCKESRRTGWKINVLLFEKTSRLLFLRRRKLAMMVLSDLKFSLIYVAAFIEKVVLASSFLVWRNLL